GGNFGPIWPACDSTAEVYDPSSNSWSSTPSMSLIRRGATATVIKRADGTRRVLVAGGYNNRNLEDFQSSVDLYDPSSNTWSTAASMTFKRAGHTATLLRNGQVLVTGGTQESGDIDSAEIYTPSTDTW